MVTVTNFPISTWQYGGLQSYDKYEAVFGCGIGDTKYYYATTNVPAGTKYNPSGYYQYTTTNFEYSENRMTFYFTQTGSEYFQPGSMIALEGYRGYTGQIIDGGNGYVTFISEAWDETDPYSQKLYSLVHPYWTTGFPSTPDHSSSLRGENNARTVSLGDGYAQRQSSFINANSMSFNLVFKARKDKEAMSIANFVENRAGVTPFELHLPNQNIFQDPKMMVVAKNYDINMVSYNLNDVTVEVVKVFEPK